MWKKSCHTRLYILILSFLSFHSYPCPCPNQDYMDTTRCDGMLCVCWRDAEGVECVEHKSKKDQTDRILKTLHFSSLFFSALLFSSLLLFYSTPLFLTLSLIYENISFTQAYELRHSFSYVQVLQLKPTQQNRRVWREKMRNFFAEE